MPDKEFIIELGTLTSVKTDESQDEFYVLGAVKAVNQSGLVEDKCTGTFASQALTSFIDTKVPETKQLDPAGEAFHGFLRQPSDYWTVSVLLMLVEQDTATTIKDVNSELIKFLAENQETISAASAATGFGAMAPFAKLLLNFIQTISNIFDKDDIFRTYNATYRIYPNTVFKEAQALEATHDDSLYRPWNFTTKCR
jgi:hypothetical protein